MRSTTTDRWLLIALLAFGAMVKFSWLGVNELSGDEPFTVFWATRPLDEFLAILRTENNPPLHFLLVKAWACYVPLEEAWLRAPSALFSTLTVWPLFLLARALGGRAMGVITCALFTLSNHQYAFAHEVRAYALMLLLSALGAWLTVRGPGASLRRSTLMLAVVFALLVWTHFFGWLVIGMCGACTIILPELRSERRRVLFAALIALVTFLPYGFIFFHRAGESIAQGTWVRPHGMEEMWHMVRRWSNQPVVTLLLLLPVLIVAGRTRLKAYGLRLALLWLSVPLIGLWCVQWWVPAFVDRYLLFASIGFYLAAAFGSINLYRAGPLRWAAPAFAVAAMAVTFTPWKDNGQFPSRVAAQVRDYQRSMGGASVIVRPFWYKLTLWTRMDRSRDCRPPWLDVWSEHYDDARATKSLDEANGFVLVYMSAADDGAPRPVFDGFRHVEEVQCDGLMRVARYVR